MCMQPIFLDKAQALSALKHCRTVYTVCIANHVRVRKDTMGQAMLAQGTYILSQLCSPSQTLNFSEQLNAADLLGCGTQEDKPNWQ